MSKMTLSDISKNLELNKEPSPSDTHHYGQVKSINPDGSYEVSLNSSNETVTCARLSGASIGDLVMVTVLSNGYAVATNTYGGDKDAYKAGKSAEEAEKKATNADSKAEDAKNKANAADTKATNADSKAEDAKNKANAADTKATNADSKAEDAKKVATNYLTADNTGIMVADISKSDNITPSNISEETPNVFISDRGVYIRDGQKIQTGFEKNKIFIGGIREDVSILTRSKNSIINYNIKTDGTIVHYFVNTSPDEEGGRQGVIKIDSNIGRMIQNEHLDISEISIFHNGTINKRYNGSLFSLVINEHYYFLRFKDGTTHPYMNVEMDDEYLICILFRTDRPLGFTTVNTEAPEFNTSFSVGDYYGKPAFNVDYFGNANFSQIPKINESFIFYKKGDTIKIPSCYPGGFITSNKREVLFTIPLDRPVLNSYDIGIIHAESKIKIRQNGKYIIGNGDSYYNATRISYKIRFDSIKCNPSGLSVQMLCSDPLPNATNNDSVGIHLSNLEIILGL